MLWALAQDRDDGLLVVEDAYFERPEPVVDDDPSTYVATEATFTDNLTHTWNHGLGEVFTALQDAGLEVTHFTEHDSAPWEGVPGVMERDGLGEWRLVDRPWRLAQTYTLQARKAL